MKTDVVESINELKGFEFDIADSKEAYKYDEVTDARKAREGFIAF